MKLNIWVFLALAVVTNVARAREWTDVSGKLRAEADLIGRAGNQVLFRDAMGHERQVDLTRLSLADRSYVLRREQAADAGTRLSVKSLAVKSLGYRQSHQQTFDTTPRTNMAPPPLVKLTGWSGCTPWYSYHPTTCCPVPHCPPHADTGKRIFSGRKSTWHLVTQTLGDVGGTGAYWLRDKNGCPHHYLALLKCWYNTAPWLGYEGVGSPGGITFWLFENGAINQSSYNVFYWNGTSYVFYDCCYREIPE